MKIKCFFCQKYTINMKFHRKVCKEYRQIFDDVFYNCIMPLVRLDKLNDCINKNLYKLLSRQKYIFNDNWNIERSYYNDSEAIYFFQNWEFVGGCNSYLCELSKVEYFIKECFKKKKLKIKNKFISLGRQNLKTISFFDTEFSYFAFFYHKYTRGQVKIYGFTCIDLEVAENILNPKGIEMIFHIATIYESIKAIKKKLINIYNE